MQVTQETTEQRQHTQAAYDPEVREPSGLSGALGKWAFAHKEQLTSEPGRIATRNFLRTLVAIVPYLFVNVGVQHGFKHLVGFKGAGKEIDKYFGKTLSAGLRNAVVQNTAAIALSFTAFRSTCKMWMASFDRIFNAKSEKEAANVIADLPGQVVTDAIHIIPSELAATGLSAGILAGIRGGLKIPEPLNGQFTWSQGVKNYPNDYVANALGYAAFFEATDRLYSVFNHNHQNGAFTDGTLTTSSDPSARHKPYAAFTNDTPTRLIFRNVASVAAAALPYIALQRAGHAMTGYYNPAKNSFLKDVAIGTVSWELPFAVFTSGIELYQQKYDALFKKLEDKYSGKQILA